MLLTICLMLVPEYAMPIWKNCGEPACQKAAVELTQNPPLPDLGRYQWVKRGGMQWCLGKAEG